MRNILFFVTAMLGFISAKAEIGFTPNQGQFADQSGKTSDQVLFKISGGGPGIFVTTTGLTYLFQQTRPETKNIQDEAGTHTIDWSAIHMELVGADIRMENVVMEDELTAVSNYYYANCPQGIVGVKSYHKITIKNIYPGIDWVLHADDVTGVSHDFLVHPNGNHRDIVMKYNGLSAPISMNEKSQLVLTSTYGTMYEGGLKVYREDMQSAVRAYFNVSNNEVRFLIFGRNKNGFVIDPPLQWSVLQASSGQDYGSAVAATKLVNDEVLACGSTDGVDFPVLNATQGTLSAQEDAVIYRLDANGNRLWSTYFGGSGLDNAKGIDVDYAGNCYVSGYTSSADLPVQNSIQPNYGGGAYDAFVATFSTAGALQRASWIGGTGSDYGMAITYDNYGSVYVVGYTNSSVNFPLVNAIDSTNGGDYDGFVVKLVPTVTNTFQVSWSTYYGGTDDDRFRAVTTAKNSIDILIAGNTYSGNFPTAGAPFQLYNAQPWSNCDAVVMRMDAGETVLYASYCGGADDDIATGVVTDFGGNAYVTGYTSSFNFPRVDPGTGAYMDTTLGLLGGMDAFVFKCNLYGTVLNWSTYFGGDGTDFGFGISYDHYVGAYVCGNTTSTDFPVMQPSDLNYYQPVQGDGGVLNDAWIALFNENDTLSWSTYFGGPNSEEAYGISVGQQNQIFVTGVDSNDIMMARFNSSMAMQTHQGSTLTDEQVSVYPNPAIHSVEVRFTVAAGPATIEITDLSGRIVYREELLATNGKNTRNIEVSAFATGVYALTIRSASGVTVQKFMKQ